VDEKELVRRCCQGDEQAWQRFHDRYRPVVERLTTAALKRGRSGRDLVEEIASAVFETLIDGNYRALRSFRWQCSIETWLRIIVRTCMIRRLRRKAPKPELRVATTESEEPPGELLSGERRKAVRRILAELPSRERQALTMFFMEDASYTEISRRMGLPMGTVATILSRTRTKLRDLLQSRGISAP
jgi:RNA polymerase sigma-70 factor (ECF subfamily)